MNHLLAINWMDFGVVAAAVAIVVGTIIWGAVRKKQGKSLTCDCSSCEHCAGCSKKHSEK